ncbi:hypothetical protein [uncultured Shewanella sp.]|uniref:hypothetical protein n=1 Tax=uncultured Shewanella sp. TaxID=173975 RepID=UPI00261799D6|nr:hypothetical protein [uncultured Shewanella sp.]
MSSPLGGLYISSLNRNKQTKFDLSRRVYIRLDVTLEYNGQVLVSQYRCFYVGEAQVFDTEYASIIIKSSFIDSANSPSIQSGLLNLKCQVSCLLHDKEFNGLQELNLSPHEPLSCLVNGHERLKITLCGKPI